MHTLDVAADIEKGARWSAQLDGILTMFSKHLVNGENATPSEPWINFEAGHYPDVIATTGGSDSVQTIEPQRVFHELGRRFKLA